MKKILTVLLFIICSLIFVENVSATIDFSLFAPPPPFQRGQNIQFTINIDTGEESYTSTQIGMTYKTQYLEYISVSAGDTFTTVSADPQGDGKLIISGSSDNGFSGSGTYAYVNFKLIAAEAGSTELCVLYNPEITPTPTIPGPSPTPGPTAPPGSTLTPVPTALPTSGDVSGISRGLTFGLLFLALAGGGFFVFKKL